MRPRHRWRRPLVYIAILALALALAIGLVATVSTPAAVLIGTSLSAAALMVQIESSRREPQ